MASHLSMPLPDLVAWTIGSVCLRCTPPEGISGEAPHGGSHVVRACPEVPLVASGGTIAHCISHAHAALLIRALATSGWLGWRRWSTRESNPVAQFAGRSPCAWGISPGQCPKVPLERFELPPPCF